jgi:hypothetical protein
VLPIDTHVQAFYNAEGLELGPDWQSRFARFDKVIAVLNVLRGPIAHCTALAPDEIIRLRLAMADWFRLMG